MAADGLIREGDHLVLDVNGEKLSFVQKLKAAGSIRVGKYMVPAEPLVGAPYGSLFEVTADGRALQRVLLPPADEITRITETDRDNSALFDRNTENQKLTHEQIEELKKSGKAGTEIIQALCSNSATFQNKTEFSQDKYKRRKAKKYLTYVTVRKPTAQILCEAYTDKSPERVWHLRHDTLAVMLSLANSAAGAKVLVAEHCMGVVTAAALERLGELGSVCAVQVDERPAPLDAVRLMNLTVAQRAVLFTAPAANLLRDQVRISQGQLEAAAPGPSGKPEEAAEVSTAGQWTVEAMEMDAATVATVGATVQEAAGTAAAPMDAEPAGQATTKLSDESDAPVTAETAPAKAEEQQQERSGGGGGYGSFLPRPEVLRGVLKSGFDSCLIALPRVHPTALLSALWPLLAPSATFAIFCPWAQPLAEAMSHLQASRNAVLLQLQESWLRPYQVLPSRTHPHMTCSGTGGYILSGIKVTSPDATPLALQLQPQQAVKSGPVMQLITATLQLPPDDGRPEADEGEGGLDEGDGAATDEGGNGQEESGRGASRGRGRGRGWGDQDNGGGGWRDRGRGRWGRGRDSGWRGKRNAERNGGSQSEKRQKQ